MTSNLTQHRPGQVLLLEKNPGLAHVLDLMLRQAGWLVKLSAVEAEMVAELSPARLRTAGINLVLADLVGCRPEEEGIFSLLRAAAALLPVIVIAPYGQEGSCARFGDQPGCHFLTSPLDPEELQRCLLEATKVNQAAKLIQP